MAHQKTEPSLFHLSSQLRNDVLRTWYEREGEMIDKMESIEQEGKYLFIPFAVNGICTNDARWNIKLQRFDRLNIPVWKTTNTVINVTIKL